MNDSPTSLPSVPRSARQFKRIAFPIAKWTVLAVVIVYVVLAMRHEFAKTTRADLARLQPIGD